MADRQGKLLAIAGNPNLQKFCYVEGNGNLLVILSKRSLRSEGSGRAA
jgi:hypothetical protein